MKKAERALIKADLSIRKTLKLMDESGETTLFVIDISGKLLGVTTNGDIRRWILKNGSLNEVISNAMSRKPVTLREGYSPQELENAKKIMALKGIESIPVVNRDIRVVSIIRWRDFFKVKFGRHKPINAPVIIMAGGEGERLSPFTKVLPKPLIPIGEKPIIELIMEQFEEYGCKKFYLSINYKSNLIKAYFSDLKHNYEIKYVMEQKPLGTVGSLHLLKNKIKSTFFINNCDILIKADYTDISKFHKENKNKITLVSSMKHYTIPYGVCEIANGGALKAIKEKPEYDFFVNTGMYVMEPEVLNDIPENKHYNITDLIKKYMERHQKIGVYPVSEKSWIDIGQWEELQKTLMEFKSSNHEKGKLLSEI
jgi:dTDP-glucose pyrophosphorylase